MIQIIDLTLALILFIYFSFLTAFESAVIALPDSKIKREAEDGSRSSQKLWRLMNEQTNFLAVVAVGKIVTLIGVAVLFIQGFIFPLITRTVAFRLPWQIAIQVVSFFIFCLVVLIFGRELPRRIASTHPERFARVGYFIFHLAEPLLSPLAKLVTIITNLNLRLLRLPINASDHIITEEELRYLLDAGRESGNICDHDKEIIENVFEFDDKTVGEAMTHRTNITALEVNSTWEQTIAVVLEEQYSRIPIYEGSIDRIIGLLHTKDLFSLVFSAKHNEFDLRKLMRKVMVTPESRTLQTLFHTMQANKTQLTIVIDEYGGTAGLITMEDLVEEIVGNLQDEYDEEENDIVSEKQDQWLLLGTVELEEVEDITGVSLPEGDYETLAGFIFSLLDRIPDDGETPEISWRNLRMQIVEMEDNRIEKVRLWLDRKVALTKKTPGEAETDND